MIEALDVLERGEECVLNQIFRVLPVTQQTHRQRHRTREVPLHDPAERITLSDQHASEKLSVLIGLIVRAKHERCAWIVPSTCGGRVRIPHLDSGAGVQLHSLYGQGAKTV